MEVETVKDLTGAAPVDTDGHTDHMTTDQKVVSSNLAGRTL
jgi:hypothetical protein